MKIKIKKLSEEAVVPKYAKQGDAGMDLVAISKVYDEYGNVVYGTGLAFEIPKGYVGLLFPRSSNSKQDLLLSNSVGVLDSGYRGEVMFKFKQVNLIETDAVFKEYDFEGEPIYTTTVVNKKINEYQIGERAGQIIILPYPEIEFEEVDELSDSERGEGGFGSTGK